MHPRQKLQPTRASQTPSVDVSLTVCEQLLPVSDSFAAAPTNALQEYGPGHAPELLATANQQANPRLRGSRCRPRGQAEPRRRRPAASTAALQTRIMHLTAAGLSVPSNRNR